jgi:hypothetical protein
MTRFALLVARFHNAPRFCGNAAPRSALLVHPTTGAALLRNEAVARVAGFVWDQIAAARVAPVEASRTAGAFTALMRETNCLAASSPCAPGAADSGSGSDSDRGADSGADRARPRSSRPSAVQLVCPSLPTGDLLVRLVAVIAPHVLPGVVSLYVDVTSERTPCLDELVREARLGAGVADVRQSGRCLLVCLVGVASLPAASPWWPVLRDVAEHPRGRSRRLKGLVLWADTRSAGAAPFDTLELHWHDCS